MLFGGHSLFHYTYTADEPFYIIDPVIGSITPTQKVEHYTMIFNTFVLMQVFNEINARKLGDKEYNVFHGFFNNILFLFIILGTIIVQYFLVQYGGVPVRTVPLTNKQHMLCLAIGMFSFVQGVLIKAFLPSSWFTWLHLKDEEMTEDESKKSLVTSFRKSFRESVKNQGANPSINDSFKKFK